MDRYAIFVDAGYVYAAGGTLALDTPNRNQVRLDHATFIKHLRAMVETDFPLSGQFLRVYWYDAAPRGVAQPEHESIARLAGLKVRLGRLTWQGQKGVDSLVLRDMMKLSSEHAICTAFLVAGDEDLRQGVIEAQDYGVKVALIGIQPTIGQNQAESLVHEADELRVLNYEELEDCFTRTIGDRGAIWPDEAFDAHAIGYAVGQEWASSVAIGDSAAISAPNSFLPRDLDAELIHRLLELGDLPASVQFPDFVLGQARDGVRAAARDASTVDAATTVERPPATDFAPSLPPPSPTTPPQSPPAVAPTPEGKPTAFSVGVAFGSKWLDEQPDDEVRYARGNFPRLPGYLDSDLLRHLTLEMGMSYGGRVGEDEKRSARAGFWQALGYELEPRPLETRQKPFEPIHAADAFAFGRAFAMQWIDRSSVADVEAARQLLERRVGLPSEADRLLLRFGSETFGDPVPIDIRHRLRDGFKDGIENQT